MYSPEKLPTDIGVRFCLAVDSFKDVVHGSMLELQSSSRIV